MPDAEPPPRKRGGQPGNANAVRRGLFREAHLTARQIVLADLAEESPERALPDTIALLRVEMFRLAGSGDYRPADLAALARALAVAICAEAKLNSGEQAEAMTALDNVLADVHALRAQR
jgi:hypothetical protein